MRHGVRCFAKFLVDHGYVSAESGSFVADTLAGPKPITFTVDAENKLATATVDMDAPILEATLIPVAPNAATSLTTHEGACAIDAEAIVVQAIESPWGAFTFACVSIGNPHAVCFLDKEAFAALPDECFTDTPRSLKTLDVARVGSFFEAHEFFPEKTNVEFAVVEDARNISMRVFERGCGETHACGTGACATQVAAHLLGMTEPAADLHLLGGVLHIALEGGHVIMTGPAAMSFSGTVDPKELIAW